MSSNPPVASSSSFPTPLSTPNSSLPQNSKTANKAPTKSTYTYEKKGPKTKSNKGGRKKKGPKKNNLPHPKVNKANKKKTQENLDQTNLPRLVPCVLLERKDVSQESKDSKDRSINHADFFTCPPEEHLPQRGAQMNQFAAHNYMYYVHYPPFDLRMDEWVPRKRLRLPNQIEQVNGELLEVKETEGEAGSVSGAKKESSENGGLIVHSGGSFEEMFVEKAEEHVTKVKNVIMIELGKFEISTWYYSPFPEDIARHPRLYFCEFHLCCFGSREELIRHQKTCTLRHPPGYEIYRSKETKCSIAVWEVDGLRERTYCENLCYIAKLFLDHKTLEYDCDPFLFYIVCEIHEWGHVLVGYFSKEKVSYNNYNLACILTLPCYQGQGYGKFLISVSYELSKIEKKPGSPEKPISDLGQLSFDSYWANTLLDVFESKQEGTSISIEELVRMTCIIPQDVKETLEKMQVLVKYDNRLVLNIAQIHRKLAQRAQNRIKNKDKLSLKVAMCDGSKLHWVPYEGVPQPLSKKPRLQ